MPPYIIALFVFMLMGIPMVFCLGLASLFGFLLLWDPTMLKMLVQRMYGGIDSFPLMAIPFFILAGDLMNQGGITQKLVNLANALVGHLRGGLAHVNILVNMIMAGISGSAVADASAIGSIVIPAMNKDGYDIDFSAAVTGAASVLGPIIPPSIIMIIYAYVMSVSVAGLFAAGIIPGIIMGLLLMVVAYWISEKRQYPKKGKRASLGEILRSLRDAFWALLAPFIILGGILGGICTPTEAAAVAAGYALVVGLVILRTIKVRDIPSIVVESAISSSVILFIVGAATLFGWLVTMEQVAVKITTVMFGLSNNPYVMLLVVNIFLLIVGMFMDVSVAILILGPLLAPVMIKMGIHPLHFSIIMCVNLTVGLITPPFGLCLFVVSGLTRRSIEQISKELFPFILLEIVVIFLITYVPSIPMFVPKLLGYY